MKAISIELTNRLAQITVANGYLTDAGRAVYRGKRRLAAGDAPVVIIFEGADRIDSQQVRKVSLAQRYTIEAHAPCDPNNPNDIAHDLLADLKHAIFSGDHTMGRTVKTIEYSGRAIGMREDGSNIAFASIDIDVLFAEDLAK